MRIQRVARRIMTDLGIIDRFLNVFSQYIDSGFGLLGPEVRFLSATLIVIDLTLAGPFLGRAGPDGAPPRLINKTILLAPFGFIIPTFNPRALPLSSPS